MAYCTKCKRSVCSPCERSKTPRKIKVIVVASDQELCRTSHFYRLAISTKALGLSRRKIPDWIADVVFAYEGIITWPGGALFEIGDEDIDAVFHDDGTFRWLSDFMNFAQDPPKQAPQLRILSRLRLIDLAFRIAHPDTAYFIAK